LRINDDAFVAKDRTAYDMLPTTVEVASIAPTLTPNRTCVCIHAPFRIDRIFFLNHHSRPLYHHWRPLYNDRRSANHDSIRNRGCPLLLDNDARRRPVRVGPNFSCVNFLRANFLRADYPLMAGNFGITRHRQIGGHCR
jgi:hypothetical protein